MSQTLTDTQTPAARGAVGPADPAAPHPAGAAPGTVTPAPPATGPVPAARRTVPQGTAQGHRDGPRSGPTTGRSADGAASAESGSTGVPHGQGAAPATPAAWSVKAMRKLTLAAGVCAAIVAAIGFVGSYGALRDLAQRHGFDWFSYVFPVGLDAGIIAMYGLDLILVWRRMPRPVLRLLAHLLTLATIVFNAAAPKGPVREDLIGAAMHAILPLLFVAVVEAVRHLIIRTNRLILAVESDRIPLHRWLLAPWPTWLLYRRMRLWEITSYSQMVRLKKEQTVYRAWLQHKHGRQWKKRAGATAMLPFQMAPYGLSVDEALDLPRAQQEADDKRRQAEADRIAAAKAAEDERGLEEDEREADHEIRRMGIDTKVSTARHDTTTAKAAAEVQAKAAEAAARAAAGTAEHTATLTAEAERKAAERAAATAERAAVRAAEAEKSAEEREAEAREAEALRKTKEDQKAAAEAEAEARRLTAEAAASTAEAARLEAERRESVARQAEADRIAAEADRDAETLKAQAARLKAERAASASLTAAQREQERDKSAAEADAEAREAEALRKAEQEEALRAVAAADKAQAVAAEREARSRTAKAEAAQAEDDARKAVAERAQAEALASIERAREDVARAEAAALEAEALIRLTPTERAERRVARMILAAHEALPADQRPAAPDMYGVTIKDVEDALGVSHTVAGQRRQAAADLIATGYTG
ncbi:DUF2637 domain-containing protein [Streptomyces sp. NPDC088557]|uniref:DUF2637 domain-containing protein n=1 Tax=Streptomyces sp. NPDC088557 TaxID=3365867 RepID=UPI0037FE4217